MILKSLTAVGIVGLDVFSLSSDPTRPLDQRVM